MVPQNVKIDVNMMTDIPTPSHSLSLKQQCAWEPNVFLSGAFSLGRKQNHALLQSLPLGGLSRPDLYPGDSWQCNYIRGLYVGRWLMGTGGSQPALPSVCHLTPRQKKHDSICTLNLWPPDLNNLSGQLSFRWCKVKHCFLAFTPSTSTCPPTRLLIKHLSHCRYNLLIKSDFL